MGFFMAVRTTLEQLEAVQTAIQKAEAAQSVTLGGGVGRANADLKALYEREDTLLQRYAHEQGTGFSVNHGIPRRD